MIFLKKKYMENANKKGINTISDFEIFSIFIIFSFLLYSLYPGKKLTEYAINEDKNYDLTEIYLKNIYQKYPENVDLLFALSNIYLKRGKTTHARELIQKIVNINDTEIKDKATLYLSRIRLYSINPASSNFKEDMIYLENYYSSEPFLANPEKEKYLKEYASVFIRMGLYKEGFESFYRILTARERSQEYTNMVFKELTRIMKAGNMLKEKAIKLSVFETLLSKDDESANELIEIYLQAGKPDMARSYSLKILKLKKLI